MFKLLKIIFYCFFTIYCCNGYADRIWMKNGDILTGTIKLIDETKLVMTSPYAGNLTIKVENIKTFEVDKPSIVKNDLYADKYYINQIKASEEPGAIITVDPGGEEQTVSITNNLILIKQKENSIFNEFTFNGNIRGGFFFEKGSKKTEQYIFDTDFVIKHNMWRQNISSNLRRSLKNDNVSTYFYTLQYNLDRFVSPQLFWQSNAQYRHDWVEDIKVKKSFGFGPGYQLWDDELSSFSLALLLNYQEMNFQDGLESRHPLGSLRWNYQRFFDGKAIRLFTSGSIGRSFDDSVSIDLSAMAGASYKVTDWFILSSTFNKDKDNTRDGNSKNISYNLGFGIQW